jgi:phenazine biosynthesis protein phzE
MTFLFNQILSGTLKKNAFALLHKPHSEGSDKLEILVGDCHPLSSVNDIPLPANSQKEDATLVLIPYRQLTERGFECKDDNEPLLCLKTTARESILVANARLLLPHVPVEIESGQFDLSDNEYIEIVKNIIDHEIGNGAGSNFVIKRLFTTEIKNFSLEVALSLFRRLLQNEKGAYWTFLIHMNGRTFIGASPELHVSLKDGEARMNPISGTYRYPSMGPTLEGVLHFLSTQKEADELYMVVEEELKMIAQFCPQGGRVSGPFLKEMSRLAHTEYFIQGSTVCDPREILFKTLFAPTVTGSPIQNACRVIAKYEANGRGYYSGIAALIERSTNNSLTLDSTILIRTADIAQDGMMRVGIGATIVRHSDPISEAAETRSKISALLRNLDHVGEKSCLEIIR